MTPGSGRPGDAELGRALREARTVAVIGASSNPLRPSYEVMSFLQARGYRIVPVNPFVAGEIVLGSKAVASLADVSEPVDIVNVFRNSRAAGEAVDAAIDAKDRLGIHTVWLQMGVRDDDAVARAERAGLIAVSDSCIAIEWRRLLGRASA